MDKNEKAGTGSTPPGVPPVTHKNQEGPQPEKKATKGKKWLFVLIPVIAVIVAAAILVTVTLLSRKKPGGAVVVTDENGVAVTDANGEPVTVVPETEIVTATDANGSVVTEVRYKDVTVKVPVTDKNGVPVTDKSGALVTENKVITPTYPDPNTTRNNVVGSTAVPVTDGVGNTARDESGNVVTTVIPITTVPAADVTPAKTEWKQTLGGSKTDNFEDIMETADGGYITVCLSNSTDGDLASNASLGLGTPYTVLTKYDKNGSKLWQKNFAYKGSLSVLTAICPAPEGGFYAVGYEKNIPSLPKHGYYEAIACRFDKSGELLWVKAFGTSTVDLFNDVALTPDGGMIAAGSVGNNDADAASFGGKAYESRACIVKYAADGTRDWANIVGGNQDTFNGVAVGKDGAIYTVGTFFSGTLFKSQGKADAGVVKFSKGGKYIASKEIAGSGIDYFCAILVASDGNVVVSGRSNSADAQSQTSFFSGDRASRGGYDAYIIKLDTSLQVKFVTPFRGQNNESLDCIMEKAGGGYICAGYTNSSTRDLKGVTTRGGNDIVIASFDKDGELVWARAFGGTADDAATGICPGTDGGYVVVGKTLSSDVDLYKIAPYGGNGANLGVIVKFPE